MTSSSRADLAKGARLEVNDALGRRVVEITKALFEIGRRETNDLRLAGSEVSRDHADIVTEDGKIVIRDKNSRYGTYVNGEQVTERVLVPGTGAELNQTLERAGRVADHFELAELMCRDALARDESCGCHFREEHQTPDGEARRDDERHMNVAAWEHTGDPSAPTRHVERLAFEHVEPTQRSYK